MMLRSVATGLVVLVGATASAAQAQVDLEFSVNGGWVVFAEGSALNGGATVGGDLTYYVTPEFGFGAYTDYAFTESDGSMFPPADLSFGDSTTLTIVNQPIEIWQYGVHGRLRLPGRSFQPYLMVGVGGYTVFLDSQQNNASETSTRFGTRFGVGVNFAVSEVAGFRIAAYDAFFPSWDANRLNPVRAERPTPAREGLQNERFPDLNPDPNALDDAVHNFTFTAAVTFRPGGM